jgi:hypothetical protein
MEESREEATITAAAATNGTTCPITLSSQVAQISLSLSLSSTFLLFLLLS